MPPSWVPLLGAHRSHCCAQAPSPEGPPRGPPQATLCESTQQPSPNLGRFSLLHRNRFRLAPEGARVFTHPWCVPRTRISSPHPSPSLLSPGSQQGLQTQAGNTPAVWPGSTGVSPRRGRKGREKERWPWVGVAGGNSIRRDRGKGSEVGEASISVLRDSRTRAGEPHGAGACVPPCGQKSVHVSPCTWGQLPPPIQQGSLED